MFLKCMKTKSLLCSSKLTITKCDILGVSALLSADASYTSGCRVRNDQTIITEISGGVQLHIDNKKV